MQAVTDPGFLSKGAQLEKLYTSLVARPSYARVWAGHKTSCTPILHVQLVSQLSTHWAGIGSVLALFPCSDADTSMHS